MRCLLRFFFILSLSVACLGFRAKADTISTFAPHSNLEFGTAAGSLVIGTTAGVRDSASGTASDGGQSDTLNPVVASTGSNGLYAIQLTTPGSGDNFYLELPILRSLIHHAGMPIGFSNDDPSQESYLYAYRTKDYGTSGTLDLLGAPETMTDTAETPEGSSWVLTLTGTVSLMVVVRRRRGMAAAAVAGSAA